MASKEQRAAAIHHAADLVRRGVIQRATPEGKVPALSTCVRCSGSGINDGGRRCGRCGGDGVEMDLDPSSDGPPPRASGDVSIPNSTSMELASGTYFDLAAPDPSKINLNDIAHSLAQINRYTGHARRPMSVAEHTLLVADRLRSQGHGAAVILAGIHHDDHEYLTGDIGRPMKILLEQRCPGIVKEIEHELDAMIWEALDLPRITPDEWAEVKAADEWALSAESYHLMPSQGRAWVQEGLFDPGRVGEFVGRSLERLDGEQPDWDAVAGWWLMAHHRWAGIAGSR